MLRPAPGWISPPARLVAAGVLREMTGRAAWRAFAVA
jgi:hypothetical protein